MRILWQPLLAAQTLRNHLMSASLLASSALVVTFFAFDRGSAASDAFRSLQFYILGITFCAAFFSFALSMRETSMLAFLAYQSNRPNDVLDDGQTLHSFELTSLKGMLDDIKFRVSIGKRGIRNSALLWAIGLRCYYLSVIVAAWIVGPVVCIVVAAFVVGLATLMDLSVAMSCCGKRKKKRQEHER